MTPRILVSALVAVFLAACVQENPALPLAETAQPVGEPDAEGYPSPEEREIFVLTNKARHSPVNQCGDWSDEFGTAPRKPLTWAALGSHGARFTAQHLHDGHCFQHASCCVLEEKPDGSVGCRGDYIAPCGGAACPGSSDPECTGGTPTADRYHLFDFGSYSGENLAAGAATAAETICQWLNSDGHRANIYSSHSELGTGYFKGPECFAHYWVQGFGSGGGAIPRIPGASAIRTAARPANASQVYFAANYYDDLTEAPPKHAVVVIDGRCHDVELALGAAHNGTYEFQPSSDDLKQGCNRYHFAFLDGDAARHTYPTTGTLGISIGGAACPDYDPAVPPQAACETGHECTDGDQEPCYDADPSTDGIGVCHAGARTCRNGYWSTCKNQQVPSAEICNALDDDCDGVTDEPEEIPDIGGPCTTESTQERGSCREGEYQCVAGRRLCISVVDPVEGEVCDGEDEDCDGIPDDGLGYTSCGQGICYRLQENCWNGEDQTCVPGTPGTEVCTPVPGIGEDEDCDGLVDEDCSCEDGAVLPCHSGDDDEQGTGACRIGQAICEGGRWGACVGEVRPTGEVCDGEDNDCDGFADESKDIGITACGEGTCRNVPPACMDDEPSECVPLEPNFLERCDGLDDDCDGEIDNGCECADGAAIPCYDAEPVTIDTGECVAGQRVCAGGKWGATCQGQVIPSEEICGDGLDQDCDGVTDEDCSGAGGSDEPPPPPPAPEEGCGCGASGPAGAFPAALSVLALLASTRRRRLS